MTFKSSLTWLCISSFLYSASAISYIDFESCPIPYMTPRAFETACDPSDQMIINDNLPVETTEVSKNGSHPFWIANKYIRTTPSVWTREPWCLFSTALAKELCVFTHEHFAKERGISFVVEPKEAPLMIQGSVLGNPDYEWPSHINPDLWADPRMKQEDIPGKGRGMKAQRFLYRGDTVQSYTPVLLVADDVMQITLGVFEQVMPIHVGVERLPPHSRQVFLDLWGQFGGDPYYDKINTNAFNAAVGRSETSFWSVYPESARYNHDCRPNTMYSIEADDLLHNLRVGRPIVPGEEISLSYLAPNIRSEDRFTRMQSQWGFNCSCAICSAPAHVRAASDDRLALIDEIELELNDLRPNRTANTDTAELLIALHEQERLDGVIGDAYMYAAFENAYLGRRHKVQLYAAKAIEHMAIWRGTGHQYFHAMIRMMYNPETEKSWKYFEKLNATELAAYEDFENSSLEKVEEEVREGESGAEAAAQMAQQDQVKSKAEPSPSEGWSIPEFVSPSVLENVRKALEKLDITDLKKLEAAIGWSKDTEAEKVV